MRGCDGAVLLGFRQLDARGTTWRPGAESEESPIDGWWTTPWLQFEAGMAVAFGLPLLVAADEEVTEGVFSPHVWLGHVWGAAVTLDESEGGEWLDHVRRRKARRMQGQRDGQTE